jgi:hypothetical protein
MKPIPAKDHHRPSGGPGDGTWNCKSKATDVVTPERIAHRERESRIGHRERTKS